ncbi:MAG: hypothetical protein ABSC46_10400 [Candidatus Limnocylindrales bacterium]|jgi:hypothetical protein
MTTSRSYGSPSIRISPNALWPDGPRRKQGPEFGVKNGDVVEATIVGNVIRSYVNGVEVLSATDDVYKSGNPGIGFNFGCANTYVDHGFSSYEVETFDD